MIPLANSTSSGPFACQISKTKCGDHRKYGDEADRGGRLPILGPEAHEELIAHLVEAQGHLCTMGEIKDFISTKLHTEMDNVADA
jgi:hypothetical protein